MNPEGREALQKALGYEFVDQQLLRTALRHESYINEEPEAGESNERLEFLGDSVLGLIVAEELYRRHERLPEGQLATMKSHLVSTQVLAGKAQLIKLDTFMQLGRGELQSHQRKRRSLMADAFEAVLGAVYLDGGIEAARQLVLRFFDEQLTRGEGRRRDEKSRLQEITQRHFKELPEYRIVGEQGPSHQPIFHFEVWFRGYLIGAGSGESKREAGQQAAGRALKLIEANDPVWREILES